MGTVATSVAPEHTNDENQIHWDDGPSRSAIARAIMALGSRRSIEIPPTV
eukprot:m.171151 g.171151  ORF g.171151 m.171151 type:complete len:50 (+) comp24221_c0_seq1:1234-1383(+)